MRWHEITELAKPLDISRDQMPQISAQDLEQSHHTKQLILPLSKLVPSQSERVPGLTSGTMERIQDGGVKPIVIDRDNRIINGHHRYDAYQQLGYDSVNVIKVLDATVLELCDKYDHKTSDEFAEAQESLLNINERTEIYVDMDGVLADFFGEWARLAGVPSHRDIQDPESALALVRDADDFWLNLPKTDNADRLLDLIVSIKNSYKILSTPLADDARSGPHKVEWVKQNLQGRLPDKVILSHNKAQYATQPDGTPNILIDDYGVNIHKWEAAGGIGFKHKDHKFERTVNNIQQHLQSDSVTMAENSSNGCARTKASACQCESLNQLTEAQQTLTAVCVLEHSDTVKGTVLFKQMPGGPTLIVGKISGLEPGAHGFHIHQYGDLSKGCESAGAHYDPDSVDHGDLNQGHVGDLGNVEADQNGIAEFEIVANRVDLVGERSVVGRAVVVHADPDDLGQGGNAESLKTGNAGNRLACGVITLKETIEENFADGKTKGKSRPGRAKKAGVDCGKSITDLRKMAKNSSGEKQKMAHWCANMKSGRNKKNK